MALTNFAALTQEQLTLWQRDLWKQARIHSFMNRFMGDGPNSMIQRISQLKKDQKGSRAVITLLADLVGDGVAGDRQLEGNEEAMQVFDQVIRIDQLRHATRHLGRMADQKSVVEFRRNAKDVLSYWHANRHDQIAFLTLSGVGYAVHNNGAPRVGSDLVNLEYAADVKPLTANRRLRWNGTTKLLETNGATTSVAAADTPMWEMFVQLKAYAKTQRIRGVNVDGEETYHVFLSPLAMAKLKLDPTYQLNLRHAQEKGGKNPLFTGNEVKIDNLFIHEHLNVFNTSGASGSVLIPKGGPLHSKWGATGDVDGCQVLFCGAQSMGFADIGDPYWDEEGYDYSNSQGISVGKISGFLNPQFMSPVTGSVENHGMLSVYVAQ
jgi:N4-gp56 family major capsid protein